MNSKQITGHYGKVILQMNNEKHIKDVYIQQDKNTQLNNLQTYLLQYLLNL